MSVSEVDILRQIRDWGDRHDDVALDVTWSKPVAGIPAPLRTPHIRIDMTILSDGHVIRRSTVVPAGDYDIWRVEQLDDMLYEPRHLYEQLLCQFEEYEKEIKHE